MTIHVWQVMASEPRTMGSDMSASDAAGLMALYDIGVVPVVGRFGELEGLVTDRDIVLRVLARRENPLDAPLGEVATTRSLQTISPEATVEDARERMAGARVKRLLVTKNDQLVGVVSLGDVAQSDNSMHAVGEAVRSITESPATIEVTPKGTEPPRDRNKRGPRRGVGGVT